MTKRLWFVQDMGPKERTHFIKHMGTWVIPISQCQKTVKLCLQLQHTYNSVAETQSLKAIIQPGNLIYPVENNPACLWKKPPSTWTETLARLLPWRTGSRHLWCMLRCMITRACSRSPGSKLWNIWRSNFEAKNSQERRKRWISFHCFSIKWERSFVPPGQR